MDRTDRSLVAETVERASKLALNDAAYVLWSRKAQLDLSELPARTIPWVKIPRFRKPSLYMRAVEMAKAKLRFEADNAEHGKTFQRLKSAHPEASDNNLRRAIRLAVRLDQASNKNFSYSNIRDYWEDVRLAIEKARTENPEFEFSDATYKELERRMTLSYR